MDKVRNWNKMLESLRESGSVKVDPKDDYWLILTTKGRDYTQDVLASYGTDPDGKKFTHVWVLRKEPIQDQEASDKLELVANCRTLKPEDKLSKAMGEGKARLLEFELGSFLWMVGSKVLDYLVFRFNVDSVDGEDFLRNCLRAKDSECSNVYFVMEGQNSVSRKPATPAPETLELLAKACASGFKIIRTANST
jgi:hypothetical protein